MNIAKITSEYISGRPSIKDCMKKGLINYSALAREICDFHKIDGFDAVLIACRRHFYKLKKYETHEEDIISLIKDAKLVARNKIMVATLDKPKDIEKIYLFQKKVKKEGGEINIIEGESGVTIVTNDRYRKWVEDDLRHLVINISEGLVKLSLVFDSRIENTSGVVNHVYGLLAEKGINVLEEMSCWTDLMIVIDEKDMAEAMKALSL